MSKVSREAPVPGTVRVDLRVNRLRDPGVAEWLWRNPRSSPNKIRELIRAYLAADNAATPGAVKSTGEARHQQPLASVPAETPNTELDLATQLLSAEEPRLTHPIILTPEAIKAREALYRLVASAPKPHRP